MSAVERSCWIVATATLIGLVGCWLPDKEDLVDPDGDGWLFHEDCDDGDASVYPEAEEICGDGVVNDCDGSEVEAMAECGLEGTMGLSDADLKLMGEAAGDYAGYSVSGAGDVDADGHDDLLVGAYGEDSSGTDAGAVFVLLGGGALEGAFAELSLAGADLKLTGEASDDYAGWSVSRTGDVDGDGRDDLLVGASGEDSGGSEAGAVYVLLGGGALEGVSGALSLTGADLKLMGEAAGDHAGNSISGAGDVDGDGRDDLLVGAWYEDSGGSNAGAAYLLFGGSALEGDSGALSLAGADLKLTGEDVGDYAGRSVSGAGDVDGDGRDDLLVGAYWEDSGGSEAGAVYVLLGGGALEGGFGALSLAGADLKLTGEAQDDEAGTSVSGAGDVDGDGRDDLLVGAYAEDSSASDAGAAYLLLGGGALEGDSGALSLAAADLELTGEGADDRAGYSVSGAGDVDGDGRDDLLVGAYLEDSGDPDAGAAYLLLGGGALEGVSGALSLSGADLKLTGEASNDYGGRSISGAGDINSDGRDDLLVGAHLEDSGGHDGGAAYLLFFGRY